jgi:hypothetical protein
MANIAFTTLVILILAAPGAIARAGYFSNEFTRQVLPRNWTDDIARAILWSIPFHVVGVWCVEMLQHHTEVNTTMNFLVVFRLLSGEYEGQVAPVVARLYENAFYITVYYSVILLAAFGLGHLLRWVVWSQELDVRWPNLLAYRSPWLYTLLGRGKLKVSPNQTILVYVDALTDLPAEVPGKTVLYRGLVSAFSTEENGTLRDIILTGAYRGKFTQRTGPFSHKPRFVWQAIEPGDYLTLKYADLKNLNITYQIYPHVEAGEPG